MTIWVSMASRMMFLWSNSKFHRRLRLQGGQAGYKACYTIMETGLGAKANSDIMHCPAGETKWQHLPHAKQLSHERRAWRRLRRANDGRRKSAAPLYSSTKRITECMSVR